MWINCACGSKATRDNSVARIIQGTSPEGTGEFAPGNGLAIPPPSPKSIDNVSQLCWVCLCKIKVT